MIVLKSERDQEAMRAAGGEEEEDCEEFVLDKETFVRDNQEVCFETDWPYFDEVEYETFDDGETGRLDAVHHRSRGAPHRACKTRFWPEVPLRTSHPQGRSRANT